MDNLWRMEMWEATTVSFEPPSTEVIVLALELSKSLRNGKNHAETFEDP